MFHERIELIRVHGRLERRSAPPVRPRGRLRETPARPGRASVDSRLAVTVSGPTPRGEVPIRLTAGGGVVPGVPGRRTTARRPRRGPGAVQNHDAIQIRTMGPEVGRARPDRPQTVNAPIVRGQMQGRKNRGARAGRAADRDGHRRAAIAPARTPLPDRVADLRPSNRRGRGGLLTMGRLGVRRAAHVPVMGPATGAATADRSRPVQLAPQAASVAGPLDRRVIEMCVVRVVSGHNVRPTAIDRQPTQAAARIGPGDPDRATSVRRLVSSGLTAAPRRPVAPLNRLWRPTSTADCSIPASGASSGR